MLNFIFWGLSFNCYAFTILTLVVKALFPDGLPNRKTKLLSVVVAVFTPYFAFILGTLVFFLLAYHKFDADEIKARLEEIR